MREPHSEQDVVFLIGLHFDTIVSETPLERIEFYNGRSDSEGVKLDALGVFDGEDVAIEIETEGKKFFEHDHDADECDLVICWNNNRTSRGIRSFRSGAKFEDLGIDVIELSEMEVYWSD